MHNRVRMVTASFLIKDLLVDWRAARRTSADCWSTGSGQNAGNWQWVAGTGPDAPPYFRVFNPVDPGPEVRPRRCLRAPLGARAGGPVGAAAHAPWELAPLELAAAGVVLGEDYP